MGTSLFRCSHGSTLLGRGVLRSCNSKFSSSRASVFVANRFDASMSYKRVYDALLVDAGGTLLQLAKPVEETYATIGRKYGLTLSETVIKQGFKRAFAAPWPQELRYQGDGKPFWKLVVSEATGCADEDYFEEVYEYYSKGDAWHLPDGAYDAITLLKDTGGQKYHFLPLYYEFIFSAVYIIVYLLSNMASSDAVKLAVVSNFDIRLRKLLMDLKVLDLFDAVIISAEVGYEKPDPRIFEAALDKINVTAGKAVHVGDDQKADKAGANGVGISCWLWGVDVKTFAEIQHRILVLEP